MVGVFLVVFWWVGQVVRELSEAKSSYTHCLEKLQQERERAVLHISKEAVQAEKDTGARQGNRQGCVAPVEKLESVLLETDDMEAQ